MERIWKHDVAISFTEQDAEIAESLAKAIKKRRLSLYYYKDEDHFSSDLYQITKENYGQKVHSVLILLSTNYLRNRWTKIELEEIQEAYYKGGIKKFFIVCTSNVDTSRLNTSIVYELWKDNPKEIAKKIASNVVKDQLGISPTIRKVGFICFVVFAIFLIIGLFYLNSLN